MVLVEARNDVGSVNSLAGRTVPLNGSNDELFFFLEARLDFCDDLRFFFLVLFLSFGLAASTIVSSLDNRILLLLVDSVSTVLKEDSEAAADEAAATSSLLILAIM